MYILLTNDDGYTAEGINTLERVLTEHGHDVCMVAPHTQQSAKSHAMSVHGSMTLWRWDDRHYSLEGTPADCVIYPIRSGLITRPDVIVSGINHGYNLSSDTIYSGTCGAARQGAMYRIPSIAISSEKDERGKYDFSSASEYLASHLESFVSLLDGDSFLSLNFPPHWNGKVEKAGLGFIHYYDRYTFSDDGKKIVLSGDGYGLEFDEVEKEYPGDMTITRSGAATATVIKINPVTDGERMEKLIL